MGKLKMALLCAATLLATQLAAADDRKSVNIWFNALGAAFKYYSGGLDLALGSFTLGPTGGVYSSSSADVSAKATAYGGRINWYPGGAIRSGLRFSAIGLYAPFKLTFGSYSADIKANIGEALVGYHWVMGVFNVGIGAGVGHYSTDSRATLRDSSGNSVQVDTPSFHGTAATLEGSVGFTF